MDRSRDAWELHLAGVPAEQIAESTGLSITDVADAISRRAPTSRAGEGPEVELARLTKLWRAVYPAAVKGDLKAHQVLLRLSGRRIDLQEKVTRTLDDTDPTAASLTGDDELANLLSLRNILAATLERTRSPRDIAALSGRYADVLERMGELTARQTREASALDEIAARRQRRRPIRNGEKREA